MPANSGRADSASAGRAGAAHSDLLAVEGPGKGVHGMGARGAQLGRVVVLGELGQGLVERGVEVAPGRLLGGPPDVPG